MIYYFLFNESRSSREAVIAFLISIVAYFVSLSVHEFAHAFVAVKMGDSTPKLMGRLSLNPFKHLDMIGFLSFMFVGIGWAKPVQVNPLNFKKYKLGNRLVSIAGVLSNFILGLIAAGIYAILISTVGVASSGVLPYVYDILMCFMLVNSFLAMYNMLPIYPMDGFNFITTFMKTENKFIKYNLKNGFKILFTIILVSLLTDVFFGFDLLDWYLALLYNHVYIPIVRLGVL